MYANKLKLPKPPKVHMPKPPKFHFHWPTPKFKNGGGKGTITIGKKSINPLKSEINCNQTDCVSSNNHFDHSSSDNSITSQQNPNSTNEVTKWWPPHFMIPGHVNVHGGGGVTIGRKHSISETLLLSNTTAAEVPGIKVSPQYHLQWRIALLLMIGVIVVMRRLVLNKWYSRRHLYSEIRNANDETV